MIRRKCRYVGGCNRFPMVGAKGMCWEHEDPENKKTRAQKKVIQRREKNQLRTLHTPEGDEKIGLKKYYEYHTQNNVKKCANCGASLTHYNDNDWFGSQHHVLPKEYFKSVMGNLRNHIVLGKWCCHGQAGTNYMNVKKMKVFPVMKAIALYLIKELNLEERRRFPDVYLD